MDAAAGQRLGGWLMYPHVQPRIGWRWQPRRRTVPVWRHFPFGYGAFFIPAYVSMPADDGASAARSPYRASEGRGARRWPEAPLRAAVGSIPRGQNLPPATIGSINGGLEVLPTTIG